MGLTGLPSLVGSVAKELINRKPIAASKRPASTEAPLGTTVQHGMVLSALGDAVRRPERRADYGLGELTPSEWDDLRIHLDAVEHSDDTDERDRALFDLRQYVERSLPAVEPLWVDTANIAGMDHLRFGGVDVDAD